MEHYLSHIDYLIWQVIQNGNGHVSIIIDTNCMIKVLPPKIAEEVVARERERKARITLLMALPEDYLAKFHKMADATEKFHSLISQLEIHGAGVSHENANQKFLRSLPSSWSQVALIMRTKPGLDTLSFDDMYNNLRVFELDVKSTTTSLTSNTQNVAFVSTDNTSSTNDVSTAYSVSSPSVSKSQKEGSASYTDEVIHSFFLNQSSAPQVDCDDLEQINDDDLEEMDLKWQGILLETVELKGIKIVEKEMVEALKEKEDLKTKVKNWQNSFKNLNRLLNTQMNANDKFGLGYGNYKYGSILSYENEVLQRNYKPFGSDVEIDYSKFTYGPKQTSFDDSDSKSSENASNEFDSSVEITTSMSAPVENAPKTVCKPKVEKEKPSFAFTNSVKHVNTSRENIKEKGTPIHSIKIEKQDSHSYTRKGLGYAFTQKACFVCGSFNHLLRDCDFHDKRIAKQAELTKSKNKDTAVKALAGYNWRNKRNTLNKVFKYNSGSKFKKSVQDLLGRLKSEMAWILKRN
uniref:Uncharacterized protein n=1 Tax=Tanacetum cinerariifolium TaxID=118510 RepID=A0A6L2MGI4_TANCI|nr:hypothetical protein [Tanacetum cinerariifolium]